MSQCFKEIEDKKAISAEKYLQRSPPKVNSILTLCQKVDIIKSNITYN